MPGNRPPPAFARKIAPARAQQKMCRLVVREMSVRLCLKMLNYCTPSLAAYGPLSIEGSKATRRLEGDTGHSRIARMAAMNAVS